MSKPKTVCAKHEQAYEDECPYCEKPAAEATDRDWAQIAGADLATGVITLIPVNAPGAPVGAWPGSWLGVDAEAWNQHIKYHTDLLKKGQ